MKKIVHCHCCGRPAVDREGKPKKAPVCWTCINHGGSSERRCSQYPHRNKEQQ